MISCINKIYNSKKYFPNIHLPCELEQPQETCASEHADAKRWQHVCVDEDRLDDAEDDDETVEAVEEGHHVALETKAVHLDQHLQREHDDEERVGDLCRQHV